jgi:hypothetical protein
MPDERPVVNYFNKQTPHAPRWWGAFVWIALIGMLMTLVACGLTIGLR